MAEQNLTAPVPRVTVIIPAYNAQETLSRAVRSVLSQTERSVEVTIVDDCSHDRTVEIARALAVEDSRVTVICRTQNGGKPIAMNQATDLANGTWIAVIDADDWFAPTRLKRLIDLAEAAGVEMVADNQVFIEAETNRRGRFAFPLSNGSKTLALNDYLAGSNPLAQFDLGMLKPILRTDFIRRHRIEYHAAARNGHDFYVLLCFFMAGGRAVLFGEPLYHYVRPRRAALGLTAGGGSRKYRFDLMRQTNDHYLAEFGARMTASQRRKLSQRGHNLQVMWQLHQLKAQFRVKHVVEVLMFALRSPLPMGIVLARWVNARVSGGN